MLDQKIIDFAHHLADLSAEITKKYFRLPNGESTKEDDSPVTKADREIEEVLRREIVKNFPTHGIIGEEFGNHNEEAEHVWILDPIDGTSSFIIGRPIFGTLIALAFRGKSILGLMNQPITGERWVGIDKSPFSKKIIDLSIGVPRNAGRDSCREKNKNFDSGSWLNGQKIATRKNCRELADAVMCSSSSFYFQNGDEKILQKISSLTKYQKLGGIIYGGDCYSYASLASGLVDIVIDPGLKIYDFAALIPIIEMAGGVVSDWEGKDLQLKSGVKMLASANETLHKKALEAIRL